MEDSLEGPTNAVAKVKPPVKIGANGDAENLQSISSRNAIAANVYYDEMRDRKYHMIILRTKLTEPWRDSYMMDVARALTKLGHSVTYCVVNSARDAEKLLPCGSVKVKHYNSWIPQSICGMFKPLMDFYRMAWTALKLIVNPPKPRPKMIFCDTHPIVIPILRIFGRYSTVIFPVTVRYDANRSLQPFQPSWFTRRFVQWAHEIYVENNCFLEIFNKCYDINKVANVLCPCVDNNLLLTLHKSLRTMIPDLPEQSLVFVAFGPYEKRTNFKLALQAFEQLFKTFELENSTLIKQVYLVIAGECITHRQAKFYEELVNETKIKEYARQVTFLRKVTVTCRKTLLNNCVAVVHTKPYDIFSATILEAMCMGCALIAPNSGFAQEAMVNRVSGFLLSPSPSAYAIAMHKLLRSEVLVRSMGTLAKDTFETEFSISLFTKKIEMLITQHVFDHRSIKRK